MGTKVSRFNYKEKQLVKDLAIQKNRGKWNMVFKSWYNDKFGHKYKIYIF